MRKSPKPAGSKSVNCAVFPGYSLERKADIVNMCKSFLSNDNKCCRDYKDLMLLVLFYLPQGSRVLIFHHSIDLVFNHSIQLIWCFHKQGGLQSCSMPSKLLYQNHKFFLSTTRKQCICTISKKTTFCLVFSILLSSLVAICRNLILCTKRNLLLIMHL